MKPKTIIAIVVPIVVVVIVAAIVAGILLSNKQTVFGCDETNGQCVRGKGTQTYEDCKKKCKVEPSVPTSLGYGCNPKTGSCELGYGADDSTCSESSPCKKRTYKCDQTTWTCTDTNEVTNITKDACDCDPQLKATPSVQVDAPPQFPNGKGTYCGIGYYYKDEYGQDVFMSCEYGTCCESNYCGPFKAADPSDEKQCTKAKDKDTCTQYATLNKCQWSDKDGCTAIKNEVGQCAPCTSDADCKTMSDKGTCSAAGKCQLSGFKCAQLGGGTEYRPGSASMEASCNRLFSQPVNPCVNETDAYTCMKTTYTSTCQDQNGLNWATSTLQCNPELH